MENKKTKKQLLEETITETQQAIINGEHNLMISRIVLEHAQSELKKCKEVK